MSKILIAIATAITHNILLTVYYFMNYFKSQVWSLMGILLMSIFILFNPLLALEFYDISFDKAIKLAKKENKLVFLMVEEEYCPWCRKMKNTTLKDKEVMRILHSDYISIKIYKHSSDLKRKFRTRFVPTIFMIDPNKEKELSKILGYISADSLYDRLFITSRW